MFPQLLSAANPAPSVTAKPADAASFAALFLKLNKTSEDAVPAEGGAAVKTEGTPAEIAPSNGGTNHPDVNGGWPRLVQGSVAGGNTSLPGLPLTAQSGGSQIARSQSKGDKPASRQTHCGATLPPRKPSLSGTEGVALGHALPIPEVPRAIPITQILDGNSTAADAVDESSTVTQVPSLPGPTTSGANLEFGSSLSTTQAHPNAQHNGVTDASGIADPMLAAAASAGETGEDPGEAAVTGISADANPVFMPLLSGAQPGSAAVEIARTAQLASFATSPAQALHAEAGGTRGPKAGQSRDKLDEKNNQSSIPEPRPSEEASHPPAVNGNGNPVPKTQATRSLTGPETPAGLTPVVAGSARPNFDPATVRHPAASSDTPKEPAWEAAPALKPTHVDANPANAEVRVNLRTEELGRVEIRTTVRDSHVMASVAVEDSAARTAVVTEFARLHTALGTHDLQLDTATVTVVGDGRQGGMAFGGGSQQDTPPRNSPIPAASQSRDTESDDNPETGNLNVLV
jgi:flagellar hook-length control protein FliK